MTDASAQFHPLTLEAVLAGLETIQSYQLRPLPPATLYSSTNRFLRLEFPPQRDYDQYLKLIHKGLLSPQFARNQLEGLPLITLEQMAQLILSASVGRQALEPSPMDRLIALLIAHEEMLEYDLVALVSEDMALLEAHHEGGVHSHYFKPNQDPALLAQLLESQGYRSDFMMQVTNAPESISPFQAYWFCRRLTVVFPWSTLLARFRDDTQADVFPPLNRLAKIEAFMREKLGEGWTIDDDAERWLTKMLPLLRTWSAEVFPDFSEAANFPKPIQELVLAEGSTEELLIPAVARALKYDLNREGILVLSVGGKNQMLQQYVAYAEQLAVPISIVLDKDAQNMLPDLAFYQRPGDEIFILEEGEFEDIYSWDLVVKTVNQCYHTTRTLTVSELKQRDGESRVKVLQRLWPELGLGLFDKVEFAQRLTQTVTQANVSPSMRKLVERIIQAKAR